VSDGNYGVESVELTLEDWVEAEGGNVDHEGYDLVAAQLVRRARRLVYEQLALSPNRRVRQAVEQSVSATAATVPDDEAPF
jgi:hypothetical protein